MSDWSGKFLRGLDPSSVAFSYALGALGIPLALALDLPLPFLLGPLLLVGALAMAGWSVAGMTIGVPQQWRLALIPIIGVAIGGAVPADFFQQVQEWWVSALAVLIFVPLAHFIAFTIYRRFGGLDARTSYFSAMPGGFIEAMELGERYGARMDMLVVLQFMRLVLTMVTVPLAFSLATGQAVGSGAVSLPGSAVPIGLSDAFWLVLAGAGGFYIGRRFRFPAPILSGPILLSALFHGFGLTEATPPGWTVGLTQWVIGTSLGARLGGFSSRALGQAIALSVGSVACLLLLAGGFALLLAPLTGEPILALILAFAPGGVSEMSLVALSLQMSAVFVTLHHLIRILVTVLSTRYGLRFLGAPVEK